MDIALETVCYVIHQARELVADLAPLEDGPGHHAPDDAVREDVADEDGPEAREGGEFEELKEFIDSLSEDEQAELVALAWIGRGTYTAEDWDEAVSWPARNTRAGWPNTSSASRCWQTNWKKASPRWACPARTWSNAAPAWHDRPRNCILPPAALERLG